MKDNKTRLQLREKYKKLTQPRKKKRKPATSLKTGQKRKYSYFKYLKRLTRSSVLCYWFLMRGFFLISRYVYFLRSYVDMTNKKSRRRLYAYLYESMPRRCTWRFAESGKFSDTFIIIKTTFSLSIEDVLKYFSSYIIDVIHIWSKQIICVYEVTSR